MVPLDTEAEPAADNMAKKQGSLMGEWSLSHPCQLVCQDTSTQLQQALRKCISLLVSILPWQSEVAMLGWLCSASWRRFASLSFASVGCSFSGGYVRVSLLPAALQRAATAHQSAEVIRRANYRSAWEKDCSQS